jgi:phage shock protein C
MAKRLYRSTGNKVIAGVCSGVAEYFEIDPTIVRIIWLLSIIPGIGIIAYIICWLAMPEKTTANYISVSESEGGSEQTSVDKDRSKRILGIALIIIGCLFLLERFSRWFDMSIIIPLGIIGVGLFVLFNARRESQ